MKILFLDQSGKLGGAELCLADIAAYFGQTSLVGVFAEGPFPDYLRQHDMPVKVLADRALEVKKSSDLGAGLKSLNRLLPLIQTTARLSRAYDLIYANTQKALVVGAIASFLSRRPLVYHLHDIVSAEHFSATNRRIIVTLANRAALVIANSQASRDAFVKAGGRADLVTVVYNGFRSHAYTNIATNTIADSQKSLCRDIDFSSAYLLDNKPPFVIGHFSRLSPWKGQHILIEALRQCSENTVVLLVGDALFGEDEYVRQLHQQIAAANLQHRVKFLGFRTDISALMAACDLVAHTSTAPEPFGRVIVEAMLCGTPVVAAAAGGAIELVDSGKTGWLCSPGDVQQLAGVISTCQNEPEVARAIAHNARIQATQRFNLKTINEHIAQLLSQAIAVS